GPVDESTFLREARWAVETYKMALLEGRGNAARQKAFFRKAHAERLLREHHYDIRGTAARSRRPALSRQGLVHRTLALHPLVKIADVYKYVFAKVLGEEVSTAPVKESDR